MKLERIDTGDYTPEEYDRFLEDIRKVNRFAGDARALRRFVLSELGSVGQDTVSVLDVGAGSGELLRDVADFSRKRRLISKLVGLELNRRSARAILRESAEYPEILSVQGDALEIPFPDKTFDFVISSLFVHHLTDRQIVVALQEMSRVARGTVVLIDLHRLPVALLAYKAFCSAFKISQLVRQDGSLSILRGFKSNELRDYAREAGLRSYSVERSFPFRLVLVADSRNVG
ncbi:MAG: methyltransferase domain-containing protein [Acidobacteria bacterium]|nr:MAG: methyltransferase domain-containing protein [Acidobacteriota bacterium]REJ97971.1 MAG: methyltransferase domain-containing protein [Acidobacteriota bacterium]REK16714.1 MAG: methyltransferase domain-containing protein [Acidobacteriota bacterium]REK42625.1 MAG: methyltransferase domain-containing protein [Acidobacteriota bacterium]